MGEVIAFPAPPATGTSVRVIFHGRPFTRDDGSTIRPKYSFVIADGNWQGTVDLVKEIGGLWMEYTDGNGWLFSPWPMQAIEVLRDQTKPPANDARG